MPTSHESLAPDKWQGWLLRKNSASPTRFKAEGGAYLEAVTAAAGYSGSLWVNVFEKQGENTLLFAVGASPLKYTRAGFDGTR